MMTSNTTLFCAILLLAPLTACKDKETPPPKAPPAQVDAKDLQVIERAQKFYDSRPSYERPKPHSPVPKGLGAMDAATCGACHTEIYKEWQVSTHRRAWLDDAQFQEELQKSRGLKDPKSGDVGWLCVNCHTPMMNQQEELVVGLEDGQINKPQYEKNPFFDKTLQEDAITCATCHVKDGVIHGPYGDGTKAPHPVAKDEDLLTEKVCTQCHQAEATYVSQNLACFFSTGREWKASKWAKEGMTCQGCHMPEVSRKIAPAFDVPVRKTRRHWFGGSLIPKKPEYEAEIAPLRKIYGSGVSFNVRALEAGQPVPKDANFKTSCPPSQSCRVVLVDVINDRAGHYMPSGDPERHLIIKLHAFAGAKTPDNAVKSESLFGTRYEWWPKIKLLSDTRVAPGATSTIALAVPGSGPITLSVDATKWRMYKEAFEHHHLDGKYVRGRAFHKSTWSIPPKQPPKQLDLKDDLTGGL